MELNISSRDLYLILCVFIMILFDVITGVVQALINRNFDSGVMRVGLEHKAVLTLILCFSIVLQSFIDVIGNGVIVAPTISVVCVFIIGMEIGSIVENLGKAYPELADLGILGMFRVNSRTDNDQDKGDDEDE